MHRAHPNAYVIDFNSYNQTQEKHKLFVKICYVNYNRHLVIKNYLHIKEKHLLALAKASPCLESLSLIHCSSDPSEPNAIEKGLGHIAIGCTQLKTLILDQTTIKFIELNQKKPLTFPSLSELSVNYCQTITRIHLGQTPIKLKLHALNTPKLKDIRTANNQQESAPQQLVTLKNKMRSIFLKIQQTKERKGDWFVDAWENMAEDLKKTLLNETETLSLLAAQYLSLEAFHCLWQAFTPQGRSHAIHPVIFDGNNVLQRLMQDYPIDLIFDVLQFTPDEQHKLLCGKNKSEHSAIVELINKRTSKEFYAFFYSLPHKTQHSLLEEFGLSIVGDLLKKEIIQARFIHWWDKTSKKNNYQGRALTTMRSEKGDTYAFFYSFLDELNLSDEQLVEFCNQLSPQLFQVLFMGRRRGALNFFEFRTRKKHPKLVRYLAKKLDPQTLLMSSQMDRHSVEMLSHNIIERLLLIDKDFNAFIEFWDKIPSSDYKGHFIERSDNLIKEILLQGGMKGFTRVFQSISASTQGRLLQGCYKPYSWNNSESNYEGFSILHFILEKEGLASVVYVLNHLPEEGQLQCYALRQMDINGTTIIESITNHIKTKKRLTKNEAEALEQLLFSKSVIESISGPKMQSLIETFLLKNRDSLQILPSFIKEMYFFDPKKTLDKTYALDDTLPLKSLDKIEFSFHWKKASIQEKEKWVKTKIEYKNCFVFEEGCQWMIDQLIIRDVPIDVLQKYCIKAVITTEIRYAYNAQPLIRYFASRLPTQDFITFWGYLSNETREAVSLHRNMIRESFFCDVLMRMDSISFFTLWEPLDDAIKKSVAINPLRFNVMDYMLSYSMTLDAENSFYIKHYWESLPWDTQVELMQFTSAMCGIPAFSYHLALYADGPTLKTVWKTFKMRDEQSGVLFKKTTTSSPKPEASGYVRGLIRYQSLNAIENILSQVQLNDAQWIQLYYAQGNSQFSLLDEALMYQPKALTFLLKNVPLNTIEFWIKNCPIKGLSMDKELPSYQPWIESISFKAKDQSLPLFLKVDWRENKKVTGVHGEGVLHLLAYQGNIKAIQYLLKNEVTWKPTKTFIYPYEYTLCPLLCAASNGHLDCMKVLFEARQDYYKNDQPFNESLWSMLFHISNRLPIEQLKLMITYCLEKGLYPNEDIKQSFKRRGYFINKLYPSKIVFIPHNSHQKLPANKKTNTQKPLNERALEEKKDVQLKLKKNENLLFQPIKKWQSAESVLDRDNRNYWEKPITDIYEINDQHEQCLKSALYDAVYWRIVRKDSYTLSKINTLKALSREADKLLAKELLNITPQEEAELIRRLKMLPGCQKSLLVDIKARLAENRQRAGRPEEVPTNKYYWHKPFRLNLAYRASRLDASLTFLKQEEAYVNTQESKDSDEVKKYKQVILMGVGRTAIQLKPWFDWLSVERFSTLEMLDLSENPIGSAYAKDKSIPAAKKRLQPLLAFLRDNKTITTLKLNNTQLTQMDLGLIIEALQERQVAIKTLQIFNNLGMSIIASQLGHSATKQLDEQMMLLENGLNEQIDVGSLLLKTIRTEYDRVIEQKESSILEAHPLNVHVFKNTSFEEIPIPPDGNCGFYALLDDPYAVLREGQKTFTEPYQPFIDSDRLAILAKERRQQVKSVLLKPFQSTNEKESKKEEKAEVGELTQQRLIAEHLQEEVRDFFLRFTNTMPHELKKQYELLDAEQAIFDKKESKLSQKLQPYHPILKKSSYRGLTDLPPMTGAYKNLLDYLKMLQSELELKKIDDKNGTLKNQVIQDITDWKTHLKEKEVLAKKTAEFYKNPALTQAYIQEAFDGSHGVWLGLHSAYLYGALSGKGVEIYALNPKTGVLEVEAKGQLTIDAKKALTPKGVNIQKGAAYRLHYTKTDGSRYPNHFTRLVPEGISKKHRKTIPSAEQQYQRAYRHYHTIIEQVAQTFLPDKREQDRINTKIDNEEIITPCEFIKIKSLVLTKQLEKLNNPTKKIFLKTPQQKWKALIKAYSSFMPFPTQEIEEGSSALIRLGQVLFVADEQLRNFANRESRQHYKVDVTMPLNMPLTLKEWALKAQFIQEFTHLYTVTHTILSDLVERDHDLSTSEEAWRCAKSGILGVASFLGGVSEVVHTLGNTGKLLSKAIKHSKVGKFASEAIEALETIPGVEKTIHTVMHFSKNTIEKAIQKKFLTTSKKLEHLSKTFTHPQGFSVYIEDLINHFIHAYQMQIASLSNSEEAAKWGKALTNHVLEAVFSGISMGYEFSTINNFTRYLTQWIEYIPMNNPPILQTDTHGKLSADKLLKAPMLMCQVANGQLVAFKLRPFKIQMGERYIQYRCKQTNFTHPGSNPLYGHRVANEWEIKAFKNEEKGARDFYWNKVAEWQLEIEKPRFNGDSVKNIKVIECPWKNPTALAQDLELLKLEVKKVKETNKQLKDDLSDQKGKTEEIKSEYSQLKNQCVKLNAYLQSRFLALGVEYKFQLGNEILELKKQDEIIPQQKKLIDNKIKKEEQNISNNILESIRFYTTNSKKNEVNKIKEPQKSIRLISHD